jgi:lipopolysaccharide transport system permease protein
MTKREIAQRYRGSALGLIWSFLNPLLMLIVYTFVFSVVFNARWSESSDEGNRSEFAITLFSGLIVFNVFSEIVNKAPGLILSNVNFVKKVIFPLEILPLVSIGTVLIHSMVSLAVLLAAQLIFYGSIPITILYFPFVLLPIILIGLGISWFLSAFAVYIRDIAQIIPVITTILMFISAVFFPISELPNHYQNLVRINPIALIVSEGRNVIVFGQSPNWLDLVLLTLLGVVLSIVGYWWFQKTRKGFADVL